MKARDLAEFGLIERLRRVVDREGVGVGLRGEALLGIGDDAAAWGAGTPIRLGTTDTLVQNVHFTLETTSWRDLGWKALAVNISDVAAMGGNPEVALVSLGLPPETEVEGIEEFYEGMAECARAFRTAILGGNVSEAPVIVLTISLLGGVERGQMLTRSAARPGDVIAVTGYLGASAAGLRILRDRLLLLPEVSLPLKEAHLRPQPRLEEGRVLARHGVRAAIDISDGLIADLQHLCEASGVGACIRAADIPVHPAAKQAFGWEADELALSGGEDYELLFAAPEPVIVQACRESRTPVTVIGEITADGGKVTLVHRNGEAVEVWRGGWEHFTGGRPA